MKPTCRTLPSSPTTSTHPQAQGASSYILDLRNNPGGLVRASIDIARLWMDGNPVVFNISGREVRRGAGMPVALCCVWLHHAPQTACTTPYPRTRSTRMHAHHQERPFHRPRRTAPPC